MKNMFLDFMSGVQNLEEIINELKWYHKRNPFIKRKIKRIITNLQSYIDNFYDIPISRILFMDFQQILLTFEFPYDQITVDGDSFHSNGHVYGDRYLYYRTTFNLKTENDIRFIVNMVNDVMSIQVIDNNHENIIKTIYAKEEFDRDVDNQYIFNGILESIRDYLQARLDVACKDLV